MLIHREDKDHKCLSGRCFNKQLEQSRGCHICTCAGLTASVALFADVIKLIEAMWTMLDTQLGALQLQKRRWTGPAGLRPWSCTPLTGPVTFLTVGALSVIPDTMDLRVKNSHDELTEKKKKRIPQLHQKWAETTGNFEKIIIEIIIICKNINHN